MAGNKEEYKNKQMWAVSIPEKTKTNELRSIDMKLYLLKISILPTGYAHHDQECIGYHDFGKKDKSFKKETKNMRGYPTFYEDYKEPDDVYNWNGSPTMLVFESMEEAYNWKAQRIPKAIKIVATQLQEQVNRINTKNGKAILNFAEIKDKNPEYFL